MLLRVDYTSEIAVLRLGASRLDANFSSSLLRALEDLKAKHQSSVLIDLTKVRSITAAGLAALYESYAQYCGAMIVGFFGASVRVAATIKRCGLEAVLPMYSDMKSALKEPMFRHHCLQGTKAVVLCAGNGSRMAPLSTENPKPMLDFLGKPVLEHILDHLSSYGVRDILLNPGYLGDQVHNHFRSTGARSVFFVNEGIYRKEKWTSKPLGSLSTLVRMQNDHSAFDDDFLVLCGDALMDLNLVDVMENHKASGADVSIIARQVAPEKIPSYGIIVADKAGRVTSFQEKPSQAEAKSDLASAGIYVVNPRALHGISQVEGLDIARDLLPELLRSGGHVCVQTPAFDWVDIGCCADYFSALEKGMRGKIPELELNAEQVQPDIWVAPGGFVSKRARISGPCYIGRNAQVLADATLEGSCVIGDNCIVSGKSYLRDVVLRRDTATGQGAWIEDVIVAPNWAVNHRFADGKKPVNTGPLEAVYSTDEIQDVESKPIGMFRVG